MSEQKNMNFNDLEQWLNERRVTEIECLVPDLTGVAGGENFAPRQVHRRPGHALAPSHCGHGRDR